MTVASTCTHRARHTFATDLRRVADLGAAAMELAERMRRGELTHGQAEGLHLFIDLERLGLAQERYSKSIYVARRREAAKLGYSVSECGAGALDVELTDLLVAYVRAVDGH